MTRSPGREADERAPRAAEQVPRLGTIALAFVFVMPLGLWLFGRHIKKTEGRFPWEVAAIGALYLVAYLWLEIASRVLS